MEEIYKKIVEVQEQSQAAALVTVISIKGSTPRDVGAKMIVYPDGSIYGSIGGSAVEAMVIEESIKCIKDGSSLKVTHNLDDAEKEDTGMICGGVMEFFIEPLKVMPHLYIFGGGHVALPLAQLAFQAGFSYTIIEDREEFASRERFPHAKDIMVGQLHNIAQQIEFKPTDFIAIVTRSHDQDYLALREVLNNPPRYVGAIGSKAKRKQIFARLRKDGVAQKLIDQVHTPIGLAIHAETPEEIAVSIVAELIQIKNEKLK
jgi:xanthine dehydrogenase accessory factor